MLSFHWKLMITDAILGLVFLVGAVITHFVFPPVSGGFFAVSMYGFGLFWGKRMVLDDWEKERIILSIDAKED